MSIVSVMADLTQPEACVVIGANDEAFISTPGLTATLSPTAACVRMISSTMITTPKSSTTTTVANTPATTSTTSISTYDTSDKNKNNNYNDNGTYNEPGKIEQKGLMIEYNAGDDEFGSLKLTITCDEANRYSGQVVTDVDSVREALRTEWCDFSTKASVILTLDERSQAETVQPLDQCNASFSDLPASARLPLGNMACEGQKSSWSSAKKSGGAKQHSPEALSRMALMTALVWTAGMVAAFGLGA